MTGPEHYREAERLLGIHATSDPRAQEAGDRLTAKAQVHATLALFDYFGRIHVDLHRIMDHLTRAESEVES